MDKKISKKERDYILYNIRGFFKHYKIEQNINKISIDIINLQKMQEEMNILLKEFNEYKEEFNSPILINRTKLKVNKKNKFITKSSDKINKKKEKLKLNDFKYDLNKSNLTLRPKTPDVSNIFNKYKKKKYNTNIGNKLSNGNLFDKNPIKIVSNSFIQAKKNINKKNTSLNNLNNRSNFISNSINDFNKTQYKERENSPNNNNENDLKIFNYTMTKIPTEFKKIIDKKKVIKNINIKDKFGENDLSPNHKVNTINNNVKKNELNKKAIKSKKLNLKNISNERFHSSDINGRNKEQKLNKKKFLNKKTNKKIFKLDLKKRVNVKTPSPLNYRQSSPLLIDHDTIIRNKNKKINYNGNYYNEHYKGFKKKISHPNLENNKKNNHSKLKSNDLNKKDITKEEEKKLDEQIINSSLNDAPLINQNYTQFNNTKNIMDLSQNILQNLELMNNIDDNKNESNCNITNLSEMNLNKNNCNKKIFSLKKNCDNLFMSNYIESLYLSISLGFFSPWEKLKLILLSKELYFKFDLKDIINDYIIHFEKQIKLINKKINKYEINIINKPFNPRKTGLNSLNFITKNEEQRLINETQHNYVLKIFEIIIILLNEHKNYNVNEESEKKSEIFKFLFIEIYKKNNVDNIKDLFIKNFVDKIPLISDEQFNLINNIVNEIPELLSPSTLLSYNRNVSYLTFFLSELYNYLTFKTNDDVYSYKIRNEYFTLNQYINKINKLKNYLPK